MVIVLYRPGGALTVSGHAGCGPRGADPVCAAASMLCETLAAALRELPGADAEIAFGPGFAAIRCPDPRARPAFITVAAGFRRLARAYPEAVAYQENGE